MFQFVDYEQIPANECDNGEKVNQAKARLLRRVIISRSGWAFVLLNICLFTFSASALIHASHTFATQKDGLETALVSASHNGVSDTHSIIDVLSPPSESCFPIVTELRQRLLDIWMPLFEGIRYVNMWGYLGK